MGTQAMNSMSTRRLLLLAAFGSTQFLMDWLTSLTRASRSTHWKTNSI